MVTHMKVVSDASGTKVNAVKSQERGKDQSTADSKSS